MQLATQPVTGMTARDVLLTQLQVQREHIRFWRSEHGGMQVEITVYNFGPETSEPTHAGIEIAEFGAFLPWVPLATVPVPAIPAGGSTILRLRTPSVRALAAGAVPWLDRILRGCAAMPYFAVNLNVFIGEAQVERHMSVPIRVVRGRNVAQFKVGDRADHYALEATDPGNGWQVAVLRLRTGELIMPGEWIEQSGTESYHVAIEVPETGTGKVDVHVHRSSTGESTVVEFNLDSNARGPGCYAV